MSHMAHLFAETPLGSSLNFTHALEGSKLSNYTSRNSSHFAWENFSEVAKKAFISEHIDLLKATSDNLPLSIVSTIVSAVIFMVGLPSNLMTFFIIIFGQGMHTPTNYFLLNLAVVDIFTLCVGKSIDLKDLGQVLKLHLLCRCSNGNDHHLETISMVVWQSWLRLDHHCK